MKKKTQLLKSLQCLIVVYGATHSQEDGEEGDGCSLKDDAEAFVLFLRGAPKSMGHTNSGSHKKQVI